MNQPQRLITVLFADVVGSARLHERLGDIEAAYAVDRCMKRIARCVESFRGSNVQTIGSEHLATFDAVEDACLAAIDMQLRIADLPPMSGHKLTIRVGMHSGMCPTKIDELDSPCIRIAARVTSLATQDQIILSDSLIDALPPDLKQSLSPLHKLAPLSDGEHSFALHTMRWQQAIEATPRHASRSGKNLRLAVHYHGKSVVLDQQAPVLTLGRDPDSTLLIEDRKASRKHARIEYRADGFYYRDFSTNGSFVCFEGETESLLRHDEIRLEGNGRVCFGSSGNDTKSDFLTFDHR